MIVMQLVSKAGQVKPIHVNRTPLIFFISEADEQNLILLAPALLTSLI